MRIVLLLLWLLPGSAGCATVEPGARKPDLVIFLTDDHSQADLSPYGGRQFRTPNTQKLAEAGLTFTRADAASSTGRNPRSQLMNLIRLPPPVFPRPPLSLVTLLTAALCTSAAVPVPAERAQTVERLDFWLPNMIRDHRYTFDEVMQVTAWTRQALEGRIAQLGEQSAFRGSDTRIKVLPYPGGRHPRIGFLEGAIGPLRGTKVSIFPPWKDGGYVVLDIPEAIFSNLGLVFLAHTHVPTIWTAQNVVIRNQDWIVEEDGALHSEWRLPNGIAFGMQVTPQTKGADFELWLRNGTKTNLTGLRTQICLLLKAAPGFHEQNQERKRYDKPLVVVKALEADAYLLLAFEHCGRVWGNEKCPCVHSDPVLPDAAPGERVSARGRLRFHEGADIAGAEDRLLKEIQALGK